MMIKPFQVKKALALIFDLLYLNILLHYFQVIFFSPFIRVVNYHDIPPDEADQFERHMQYYIKNYSSVLYEDLIQFHEQRQWHKTKPGLIISFDDGHSSFYEIVAPLLEKYGFTGWFFIPVGLIDVNIKDQYQSAIDHRIFSKTNKHDSSKIFLTWNQILELDKNHVIGCHTLSHQRLCSTLTEKQLYEEINFSKQMLEQKLLHEVKTFAWVGGEESSYSNIAAKAIRIANYEVVFQTNNSIIKPSTNLFNIDRTNIESSFPLYLLRFQLSGILDILYTFKRNRVRSVTGKQTN